jgi:hypothetical protein
MVECHAFDFLSHSHTVAQSLTPSMTEKNSRTMISEKTVFRTLINEKRAYKFATGDKPFVSVYNEDNKLFFRLAGIS